MFVYKVTFEPQKNSNSVFFKVGVEWYRLPKALLKSISTNAVICILSMALKM